VRAHSQIVLVVTCGWLAATSLLAAGREAALAQPSPPGGSVVIDHLYATAFVSSEEGWAVGAFGGVFRTKDGGKSWQPQVSGTIEPLFGVDFVDGKHGWTVGRSGTVLHTTDAGATWSSQTGSSEKHLFGVDFVDRQHGWAVGDWGEILSTSDGGKAWRSQPFERDVILNGVSMADRERGWIVGEMGVILATADGGDTWIEQSSGVTKSLFGVHFADARRGWAVGIDALVLHTEDGGASWQVQNGSTEFGALEQVGFTQAFDQPSLYAVAVAGDVGFAVGEIGAIFTSTDAGRSWKREAISQTWGVSWLRDVSVVQGTHGAIVGAEGQRVMIRDGRVDVPHEKADAS
jgi:photosystem II stability/assembly factor-like uncharacterized protein